MKVLKFYAEWCGPCKAMSATLDTMDNLPEIENIDIDEHGDVAMKYGVRGVPTMIKVDDEGAEIERKVGNMTKAQIQNFLEV